MLKRPQHEDFEFMVEEFGPPETLAPFDDARIERFAGRIPDALLAFWQAYGLCRFWNGLLRFCDPDEFRDVVAPLVGNDSDLDPDRCHLVAYSAFAELYIWSEQYQRVFVDLKDLTVTAKVLLAAENRYDDEDRAVAFLFAGEKSDFDMNDRDGKLLYSRCRRRTGALEGDECYGFFPALLMGGEPDIGMIRRTEAKEHFAFLSQLDRPTLVRVLPNGRTEAVRQIG